MSLRRQVVCVVIRTFRRRSSGRPFTSKKTLCRKVGFPESGLLVRRRVNRAIARSCAARSVRSAAAAAVHRRFRLVHLSASEVRLLSRATRTLRVGDAVSLCSVASSKCSTRLPTSSYVSPPVPVTRVLLASPSSVRREISMFVAHVSA